MVDRPSSVCGYTPVDPENPRYFRLASHAMGPIREAMKRVGILDTTTPEPDLSAHWPPPGIDEDRFDELQEFFDAGEELDDPPSADEAAIQRQAESALLRLTEIQSSDPRRVPLFKFCSNDDWWVSPRECAAIAKALDAAIASSPEALYSFPENEGPPLDQFIDVLRAWSTFNLVASSNGGYRVR